MLYTRVPKMFSMNCEVKCENISFDSVCSGCLSSDRKLTPLGKHSDLFYYLLSEQQAMNYRNTLLCWECIAYLRRIRHFQRRIRRAQEILHSVSMGETKTSQNPLSNLRNARNLELIILFHDDKITYCDEELEAIDELTDLKSDAVKIKIENACDDDFLDIQTEEKSKRKDKSKINSNIIDVNKYFKCDKLSADRSHKTNKEEEDDFLDIQMKEKSKTKKKSKINSNIDVNKCFKKVFVSQGEFSKYLENERSNEDFLNKSYKCQSCVYGFSSHSSLVDHEKKYHSEDNSYTCIVCDSRLPTAVIMASHWQTHCRIYQCVLCQYVCVHRRLRSKHVREKHSNIYQCAMCEAYFDNRKELSTHNKQLHKKLICDHCGRRFTMRRSIVNHIKRNHGSRECQLCKRSYKTYHSLENHYRMRHPFMLGKNLKTEDCYCVECDKQFDGIYKYRTHLRTSVRHAPQKKISVPCPECGKVFSKKTYMNNHLRLAHVKQSKHYCEICDKYFITGFSVRQHKRLVHEKRALPKDKICNVCGRGFSANRTLVYHMRTHTGEKPYRCDHCPATFAQKIAMKSHTKSIHLKHKLLQPFVLPASTT